MEFHPQKCQILSITRNAHPLIYNYTLHGISLEHTPAANYLGVTLTHDLRWNQHVDIITSKASKSLSFLRRNLQINNQTLKTKAYLALVRPHLEYACAVWDPHTKRLIHQIEMVQRTAARYVTNTWRYDASVTEILENLKWPTLAERRRQQRLAIMYKVHHKSISVNINNQYAKMITKNLRKSHNSLYLEPHFHADYLRNTFFPRTIREWNSLPAAVISSPSLDSFKIQLRNLDLP